MFLVPLTRTYAVHLIHNLTTDVHLWPWIMIISDETENSFSLCMRVPFHKWRNRHEANVKRLYTNFEPERSIPRPACMCALCQWIRGPYWHRLCAAKLAHHVKVQLFAATAGVGLVMSSLSSYKYSHTKTCAHLNTWRNTGHLQVHMLITDFHSREGEMLQTYLLAFSGGRGKCLFQSSVYSLKGRECGRELRDWPC
jgi:hypothetical protein